MNRFLKIAWAILTLILLGSLFLSWNELPDRIATHFDGGGHPNGWSSGTGFLTAWLFTILATNIWPLLFPYLGRWMFEKCDPRFLSLPNKKYWLSTPERRERAARVVETTLLGTIVVVDLVLLMAFDAVRSHSRTGEPQPMHWSFFVLLATALVFSFAYPIRALRKTERDEIPVDLDADT